MLNRPPPTGGPPRYLLQLGHSSIWRSPSPKPGDLHIPGDSHIWTPLLETSSGDFPTQSLVIERPHCMKSPLFWRLTLGAPPSVEAPRPPFFAVLLHWAPLMHLLMGCAPFSCHFSGGSPAPLRALLPLTFSPDAILGTALLSSHRIPPRGTYTL